MALDFGLSSTLIFIKQKQYPMSWWCTFEHCMEC